VRSNARPNVESAIPVEMLVKVFPTFRVRLGRDVEVESFVVKTPNLRDPVAVEVVALVVEPRLRSSNCSTVPVNEELALVFKTTIPARPAARGV